jgi:hypothetical protein
MLPLAQGMLLRARSLLLPAQALWGPPHVMLLSRTSLVAGRTKLVAARTRLVGTTTKLVAGRTWSKFRRQRPETVSDLNAFALFQGDAYNPSPMRKHLFAMLALASIVGLAACTDRPNTTTDATAAPWECIAARVTIGTNSIDTVVRYNKVNGEAQLLNAASFASQATGAQGNVIGWVPLGDLRSAVQELVQREQAALQQIPAATPTPSPSATPEKKKR